MSRKLYFPPHSYTCPTMETFVKALVQVLLQSWLVEAWPFFELPPEA